METPRCYNLLRPVTLDDLRRREPVCFAHNAEELQILTDPDPVGTVCVQVPDGHIYCVRAEFLRLTPLFWLKGKPVYYGESLYDREQPVIVCSGKGDSIMLKFAQGLPVRYRRFLGALNDLSWDRPEAPPVKREVKLLAWFGHGSLLWKEEHERLPGVYVRVPSEDKTIEIEIEEPAEGGAK